MIIRQAAASDVAAIVPLLRTVLAEFGLTFGEGSETDVQVLELPRSYTDHGGNFWVALDDDDGLLGTCGMFPLAPGTIELRKMYLAKAARGKGVGKQLLATAVAWAHERHAERIVLDTTHQMTQAIAFYEANGFVRDDAQIRGSRCSRGYIRYL